MVPRAQWPTCLDAPDTNCLAATNNVALRDLAGCGHSCHDLATCDTPPRQSILLHARHAIHRGVLGSEFSTKILLSEMLPAPPASSTLPAASLVSLGEW